MREAILRKSVCTRALCAMVLALAAAAGGETGARADQAAGESDLGR